MPSSNNDTDLSRHLGLPVTGSLVLLAGLLRLIPHPWNLTPVGALGLFAGARLRSWHAFAVPLLVMVATDAILVAIRGTGQLHLGIPFVYGSFLLNVLIGRLLLRRTESPLWIGGASLLCSVQFFLVTNLGHWLTCRWLPEGSLGWYPPTWEGLLACYVAAVTFERNTSFLGGTAVGDLLYSVVFFGLFALLARTRLATTVHRDPARLAS